ncbi:primosomal protein N' [Fructilactobacillus vespulae]|uniref:primosomal protein N' n=1 Tax=Fructilactobacillus vespulae TaxID=1249630 RepID=UPI0039B5DCC6
MKIADVIVDVPTMQTDTPFSYLVPTDLQTVIKKGMRVVVPFGNGNRKIEGFVVDLNDNLTDGTDLKAIDSVMDFEPVLNQELIDLSNWLARTTYSFQISCLLTMLPNLLKAKYEKEVELVGQIEDPELTKIFTENNNKVLFDNEHFSNSQLSELLRLKKSAKVQFKYQVKNEARAKTELAIKNEISDFETVKKGLNKSAKAQFKLLNLLTKYPNEPLIQREIIKNQGISISAIKAFSEKKYISKQQIEKYRNPYKHQIKLDQPKVLTKEQSIAVQKINDDIKSKQSKTYLVEGVTGSGKTEVYLQTIQQALELNQTALMLVPEISLTPQIVNRVKSRFGSRVAILHSGLSNGEKYDEWRRIRDQEVDVVVGARSAIFAPLKNIGLIILDEEHDTSYKQDDNPRYHTRDVAIWRSNYYHCPVVLGSATPSLESRARAEKGVYELIRLTQRVNQQTLPQVQVVDMTQEIKNHGDLFSGTLIDSIKATIAANNQVVLLLNRRGFSSFMLCRDCGYVLMCPNCDISLTMHLDSHTMKCHYCGFEEAIPNQCPNCKSKNIRYFGTGTEKAEKELQQLIPESRIIRMDVDTTRKKGAHERILNAFGSHQADILLGTQIIAKGLDFPDVTLVGVLNADTGLELPDFRSSERTFDLLTQVSGRAGRADKTGKVIIQTFNPDHYAIQLAKKQDYEGFFRKEMKLRHLAGYSPYYYSVKLTISSLTEQQAAQESFRILEYLKGNLGEQTMILGPTPRPIARIKKRYYYQIIIKFKKDPRLAATLRKIQQLSQTEVRKGLRIAIDSEPVSFM